MRKGLAAMRRGLYLRNDGILRPKMLNPNGTYAGSSIKNISNRKKEMTPT
jgi:hypothetical protein